MAKMRGVFSTMVEEVVDRKKTTYKIYWIVQELDSGDFEAQRLGKNLVPLGGPQVIERKRFLSVFEAEPEFYVQGAITLSEADVVEEGKGEPKDVPPPPPAGERSGEDAEVLNEENLRANFQLGMMYLEQGMSDKADAVFDRILAMDASFTPEHKHLLNGLGIDLRKSKQLDKAIAFYQKADDLSVEPDEHVLFNMARAYYEKGDMRRTTDLLNRSLKLNPQLKVSQLFLNYLKNQTAKSGKARVYISD